MAAVKKEMPEAACLPLSFQLIFPTTEHGEAHGLFNG